jgi:hypothetical protein
MACPGGNGQWADFPPPRYFAGGGRERDCEHGGALMPVISNAIARAMVIDSMDRGRYKQPIQVSERGQYWRRRAADGMLVWLMYAVDRSSSLTRANGLAVVRRAALPAQARGLSSANPNLWVRWEYARRRCSSGLGC